MKKKYLQVAGTQVRHYVEFDSQNARLRIGKLGFRSILIENKSADSLEIEVILEKLSRLIRMTFRDNLSKIADYDLIFTSLAKNGLNGYLDTKNKRVVVNTKTNSQSLMHEIGHLFDHVYMTDGTLVSSSSEFTLLAKQYKAVFSPQRKNMEEQLGEDFVDYYFKENEIFARCFSAYWEQVKDYPLISSDNIYDAESELLFEEMGYTIKSNVSDNPAFIYDPCIIEIESSLYYEIKYFFDRFFTNK